MRRLLGSAPNKRRGHSAIASAQCLSERSQARWGGNQRAIIELSGPHRSTFDAMPPGADRVVDPFPTGTQRYSPVRSAAPEFASGERRDGTAARGHLVTYGSDRM